MRKESEKQEKQKKKSSIPLTQAESEQLHREALDATEGLAALYIPSSSASKYPPLALESYFKFGKHKGELVEHVVYDNPDYIRWLIKNEVSSFEDTVYELLEQVNHYS